MAEEVEQAMAEKRAEAEIGGNSSRYLANPWLGFVGWDDHLQKFRRADLLQTIEPSQEENPEAGEGREVLAKQLGRRDMIEEDEEEDRRLAQACAATKRLIKKAIATARPQTVGRSALEFINRREVREGKNERPFYARQKASTIKNMGQDAEIHLENQQQSREGQT
ncbi:hypothetical protein LTR81_025859 [Elasticomyces elasticus]